MSAKHGCRLDFMRTSCFDYLWSIIESLISSPQNFNSQQTTH